MINTITEVMTTLFGIGIFLSVLFMIVGIGLYYYEKYTKHKNKRGVPNIPRNIYRGPRNK
jgi:preprotein translocase subunit SecG